MIGVRNQYSFTKTKNAAEAAMLIATTGGELVNITKAGFIGNGSLAGNEVYAPVPLSWVELVAVISETDEFKQAVEQYRLSVAALAIEAEDKRIKTNSANAEFIDISNMLKKDLVAAKARYAEAFAKHGNIVSHDYIAREIAEMEYVAPVVNDLKAQVLSFLKTVEKATYEQVAKAINADDFQVNIKLSALVRDKKATQDKRGFFYAV